MKALYAIALALVVIGAINWGLVGLFDFGLVAALFGYDSALTNVIYILVGLAGLAALPLFGKLKDSPATDARDPAHRARPHTDPVATTPTSPSTARAKDMSTARTHATATPMGKANGTVVDRTAAGTTHDPNSTTTGTSVEPTHDVYRPKGERVDERRVN